MKIYKVQPYSSASNEYILTADDKTAVVIDPSDPEILRDLNKYRLECKAVLLTHGHYDHIGGCGVLFEIGAAICCGEREKDLIFSNDYKNIFGGFTVPRFCITKTFSNGEEFSFCGIKFIAISTPGHTAGGVSYLVENNLFTGDTLFRGCVGRTDLPTGDFNMLVQSVKKLYSLKGDYYVYCGHGFDTTLEFEREHNPFIRNN